MPEIIRRTPKTEKAQEYSIPDLIIELAKKVVKDTKKGIKKKVSKKLTDEEILDIALAPQAGVLRPKALAQMISSLKGKTYRGIPGITLKQVAFDVPQKELSRIKSIRFDPSIRPEGQYVSPARASLGSKILRRDELPGIALKPTVSDKAVVPHEFTHARQFGVNLKGKERAVAALLLKLDNQAWRKAEHNMSTYLRNSPLEYQATRIGETIESNPELWRHFDKLYLQELNYGIEKAFKSTSPPIRELMVKMAREGKFDKYFNE